MPSVRADLFVAASHGWNTIHVGVVVPGMYEPGPPLHHTTYPSLDRPCVVSTSPSQELSTREQLASKGQTMTTAEMVSYAYDQIDQTRAELN